MSKHMIRALGLSLLTALGLIAVAAASAQAGEIRVLGSAALATGKSITGEQVGTGLLLIPGLNLEIACTGAEIKSASILSGPTGEALGEVLYTGCEYWSTLGATQELLTLLPCTILEEGTGAAGAIVAKAKLLVILHNTHTYVLAEPDGGTTFASVKVTAPSECPVTTLVEVKGSIVFKVTLGTLSLLTTEGEQLANEETHVTIQSTRAINELFGPTDQLKYGIQTSYIDGTALLLLSGSHIGCKWGLI